MEAFILSLALLVLFVTVVSAAPFAYAAWRRALSRESELQIWRVLQREGVSEANATPGARARAVRRCTFCPSIEECDGWLAGRNREDPADFCPNASYIAHLKH